MRSRSLWDIINTTGLRKEKPAKDPSASVNIEAPLELMTTISEGFSCFSQILTCCAYTIWSLQSTILDVDLRGTTLDRTTGIWQRAFISAERFAEFA